MIIDSSALIAVLRDEPEAESCAQAIEKARVRRISAVTYVEAAIVVDGNRNPLLSRRFDDLVRRVDLVIEPVTEEHAKLAREAYRDYGKRSGHRAQLNFGDCFAYALARSLNEPLLFKGDDFTHTDIARA
jgi:ribonuclease VapC